MSDFKITMMVEVNYVRNIAMSLAKGMGFSQVDQTKIAIAVSELGTNIVKYAGSGDIQLLPDDNGIVIVAKDEGPGISNIDNAFQDHWSDSKCILDDDYTKHDGMGTGLPAVKRLMDECEVISTSPRGTVIRAVKYIDGLTRAVS